MMGGGGGDLRGQEVTGGILVTASRPHSSEYMAAPLSLLGSSGLGYLQ